MKPDWRLHSEERNRTTRRWLRLLVIAFPLLFPCLSFGADLEVSFEQITPLGGSGPDGREFLPGDEIQVSVRLRVLQASGNPFFIRLRITGDGWHEILTSPPVFGSGVHVVTFGGSQPGLFVDADAGKGKVSLLADILSEQDTVALQGRRHAYLDVGCPSGLPEGAIVRFPVGAPPQDMALTPDERYLYVTRDVRHSDPLSKDPEVTVIDLETKTLVVPTEIEYSEAIKFPQGVAASPSEPVMYIADIAQVLHVIDAETHVLQRTIELNPTGELGQPEPGDVAVNQAGTEVYVADSRGRRIFVVDLNFDPPEVRVVSLSGFFEPPAGSRPVQVMPDPDNPRFIYVLCQGQNEVIKVDVVSDQIMDFVQLGGIPLLSSQSMALSPSGNEIYVVVNPNDFELTEDQVRFDSKIIVLTTDWLGGPGRRDLPLPGSSIWELVVREDGLVYAIDSYRGEILVIDVDTGTEMSRCAVPVEPAGRLLRADREQNRLFVAGGLAGFVDLVE